MDSKIEISTRVPDVFRLSGPHRGSMKMQRRVSNCPYLEDLFAGKIWLFDSDSEIEITVAGQRGNFTQLPP